MVDLNYCYISGSPEPLQTEVNQGSGKVQKGPIGHDLPKFLKPEMKSRRPQVVLMFLLNITETQ